MASTLRIVGTSAVALAALTLSGCTRDWKSAPVSMWNESRYKPYEATSFFADQSTSRPTVQGTVARGQLRTDEQFFNGTQNGKLTTQLPFPATKAVLERGQNRFNIYCQPCHGEQGAGNGMIVQRGFSKPPDYTEPRLINAPVGHFYDVITNGYGSMYSYASRVPPRDRWAIAAYIRVLQRSRTATVNDVPANQRAALANDLAPDATTGGGPANGPNAMSHRGGGDPLGGAMSNGVSGQGGTSKGEATGNTTTSGIATQPEGQAPGTPRSRSTFGAPVTTTKPSVRPDAQSPATQVVPGTGTKSDGPAHSQFGPNERRENGGTTTTPSGAPASAGNGTHS